MNVFQERDLYESVALSKGLLEFFLIVLRRVCDALRLDVMVGTHAVGEEVGSVGKVADLLEAVRGMPTWMRLAEDLPARQELLLPVPVTVGASLRECVLVEVRSTVVGEALGPAGGAARACV